MILLIPKTSRRFSGHSVTETTPTNSPLFTQPRGTRYEKKCCVYLLQVGQALAMRCRCRAPDFDITGRPIRTDITYAFPEEGFFKRRITRANTRLSLLPPFLVELCTRRGALVQNDSACKNQSKICSKFPRARL